MRILHVHWAALPAAGGVETHIDALARAQREAGHDVDVVAGTPGSRAAGYDPALDIRGDRAAVPDLTELLARARGRDVVQLHNPQWHRPEVLDRLLAELLGEPWRGAALLDVHNLSDRPEDWERLHRWRLPIVVHSEFVARQVAGRLAGAHVRVLPLALPRDEEIH
ncbi:MAG TPA: glycosyltransferase, partial [Candidatus Dormibacteraeota bacterium]